MRSLASISDDPDILKILDLVDGEVRNSRIVERTTGHFAKKGLQQHHSHQAPGNNHPHGLEAHSSRNHDDMVNEIQNCKVVIAGGMGPGAVNAFHEADIEFILTHHTDIMKAASEYIRGEIRNLLEERMC